MAIWICFHNVKVQAQRREQGQRQQAEPRELAGCVS
jgi:hypothetical protein